MFKDIIRDFIAKNALLTREGLHLVALSGGADSVALLCVLRELEYKVEAIHCNFNLRGEESNRDEDFCKDFCRSNGIKLHLAHFDTRFYSQQHHVSIEMAARELRYNYFHQLQKELKAESICVAHHKDDNAETVLMNLVRGTGLAGLTGIHPKNGSIIRPLLCVGRADIEDYLTLRRQSYVTDSSNLVSDVKRNKIRNNIMPHLKELNPSATEAIIKSAQHIIEAMPLLEEALSKWKAECIEDIASDINYGFTDKIVDFKPIAIDIDRLNACPSPRYLLYSIFSEIGIPSQITAQVYENIDRQTGTSWQINNRIITIDRGKLLIEPQQEKFRELRMPLEGKYVLCNGDRLEISKRKIDADFRIDTSAYVAQLDADILNWPLTIRAVERGDRFVPFGMTGSKLVSDILTDRKLSLQQKRRQLCVTDASGQLVWLTGLRISNKHRITPNTINVVCIRYIKKHN